MAIMFVRAQLISRGAGRSVVSAAAYRHRTVMTDEQAGTRFRYTGGAAELVHEELALPENTPAWLRKAIDGRTTGQGCEALWNAVDRFERRADAQLAREIIFALPEELTRNENIELIREFVRDNLTSRGMIADWVYHDKEGNPHVHLMTTLRPLTEEGFGPKKVAIVDDDRQPLRVVAPGRRKGKIAYRLWAGDRETMKAWKIAWAETANRHLALSGFDIRIDGRSFEEQGFMGVPQKHLGAAKAALTRKGREMFFAPADQARRQEMADRLAGAPELLLTELSKERSTFNERDIARALHRYVDDPITFANIRVKLIASSALVLLRPQQFDSNTGEVIEEAVFTTRATVRAEHDMVKSAVALSQRGGFSVAESHLTTAITSIDGRDADKPFSLDEEQIEAVRHVTGSSAIAPVVGLAGAGKSELLKAARVAWECAGRRVVGAALAGKAAEGLEQSSGIASRTLAAWEFAWANGRERLDKGDILVVDEAGMVSSQQMGRLLRIAEKARAKIVLVGDPMQLQPIQAGAAFRAILERIEFAELAGVRRQRDHWARDASRLFADGEVEKAVDAYAQRGHVIEADTKEAAIARIVSDWTAARTELVTREEAEKGEFRPDALLVLTHTNNDVRRLNEALRVVATDAGALGQSQPFDTERGAREFAAGDRIIFLRNARFLEPRAQHLGPQRVKNGTLGTVLSSADERGRTLLKVRLDKGQTVVFGESTYRNIDHGYAATIHKSQGATVDRTFVLATGMMDRHLVYVAMTRHRGRADLYAAKEDFESRTTWEPPLRANHASGITGELIETGSTKFRDGESADPSPYVDVRCDNGATQRLWGVSLPKALRSGGVSPGDTVTLRKDGVEDVAVRVPVLDEKTGRHGFDERIVGRNIWTAKQVETAERRQQRLAAESHRPKIFRELVARLSRSGAKTTTLDYESEAGYQAQVLDFARRRGIVDVSDTAARIREKIGQQLAWIALQREKVLRLWERAGAAVGLAIEGERRCLALDGNAATSADLPTAESVNVHDVARRMSAVARSIEEDARRTDRSRPMLAGASRFKQSIEDAACERAFASALYRQQRARLGEIAADVWRIPDAALALIESLIAKRIPSDRIAAAIANDPAAYGPLRGSKKMIDRLLAGGRERRDAWQAIDMLAVQLRSLGGTFAEAFAAQSQIITAERTRMTIEIPGLSHAAEDALTRLTEAVKKDPRALDAMVASLSSSVREEFAAVSKALDDRFGRAAIARDDKDVVKMVPPDQLRAFEAMRLSLRMLQRAVQVESSQKVMSRRLELNRGRRLDI